MWQIGPTARLRQLLLGNADVLVTYNPVGQSYTASRRNLKPNFVPTLVGNRARRPMSGLVWRRWWQQEWTGTGGLQAGIERQRGGSSQPNDTTYLARDTPDASSNQPTTDTATGYSTASPDPWKCRDDFAVEDCYHVLEDFTQADLPPFVGQCS
jgi:hypothetical protein